MTPKANGRKQARRLRPKASNPRISYLKMKREKLFPDDVVKALAAMGLPKDKRVWNAKLRMLLSPRSEPRGDRSGGRATALAAAAGPFSER